MARKVLTRLNQRGDEVPITGWDPDAEREVTETVWLQKINGPDHNAVNGKANAARARVLAAVRDPEGDGYMAMHQQAVDFGDNPETLIEYLVQGKVADRLPVIRAEMAEDDESPWNKDDYLLGLQDAWEGVDGGDSLKGVWAASEAGDDSLDPVLVEESRRVFGELNRFQDELTARLESEKDDARRYFEVDSLDELRLKVTDDLIRNLAEGAWFAEFRLARIFYGTRENGDRSKRYFDQFEELLAASEEVKATLLGAYDEISVKPLEGKDSRPAPSSSDSSEPPAEQADSGSSGRTTAAA